MCCRYWADECISDNVTELCARLVNDLAHGEVAVRGAAAEALAAALTQHGTYIPSTLDLVLELYTEHLKVSSAVSDVLLSLYFFSSVFSRLCCRKMSVGQRISYNLCLLMHYIHTSQAPQYLSNCVSTISSSGNR